jgi:hypothetical protein
MRTAVKAFLSKFDSPKEVTSYTFKFRDIDKEFEIIYYSDPSEIFRVGSHRIEGGDSTIILCKWECGIVRESISMTIIPDFYEFQDPVELENIDIEYVTVKWYD